MRRRLGLLALLGALAVCAGCGRASFSPGFSTGRPTVERWIEIVTPHFVLATDVAEPEAVTMAHALESLRAALLASAWPKDPAPRGRTRVISFARQRELSRYAGRNTAGAVFTRPGFERLLAITAGSARGVPKVATHELVHDLSRWYLPVQPLWLSEGLAMELETIWFDRTGRYAVTGGPSRGVAEGLQTLRAFPRTSQLFAVSERGSVAARDTTSFYLGSWALVHYLRSEQPERFARFQQALMQLTPWRLAWEQSFPGLTHDALDEALRAHLSSGRSALRLARFRAPAFSPSVRALSSAEVHGLLALLANTSGEALAEAETAAALELDPSELNALTVRFHSLPAHARAERAELAQRAVTAHPHAAEAWLLAALAAGDAGSRQRALAQAQRLNPDHPGVVALLAEDALARNDPGAALLHVRHAQRRSGVTPRTLALQFAALAAANRCADAAAVLEHSPLLLRPRCRVTLDGSRREMACSSYVRWAYAPASSCAFEGPAAEGSWSAAPPS